MKRTPANMFFPVILTYALLLLPHTRAMPSPQPAAGDSATYYSSSGFISSPSIYSYTVENQLPTNQTATIYEVRPFNHVPQSQQKQQPQHLLDSANRNLYYTSSNSNLNSNVYSGNRKAAGPAMTTSTTTAAAASSMTSAGIESTQPAPISDCTLDRLAVYKVVLHTYWTRELFPKHYPDWRPTAQWTKTLGRTHDSTFALYHIGRQAAAGVKQFAETGKSDILDTLQPEQQQQSSKQQQQVTTSSNKVPARSSTIYKSNTNTSNNNNNNNSNRNLNERSVFDEFNMPPIMTGAGRTEAKFFVDSNHSLVSLMTRIVPSPDWFIGVDSFQLCVGGSWIDTVTVEMDPLDAGTDNGFTFTAPNWPTSPQGVIYRITSRYPAHPAGSFFYPKSKRLPPIATFQFIKLKEYELSEVFNFAEDDRKYETVQTQTHLEMEHNHVEMNNELSASIERERQNEITPQPTRVTEKDRIRSQLLEKMNPMINTSSPKSGLVIPKNDKQAIMQNIANSYRRSQSKSSFYDNSNHRRRTTRRTRDCRVSHWSEWSDCSKLCGIGEMHRYRKVIKHGKRGGRPCPPLKESKWCGSEKGCHKPETYFNWSNT